VKEDNLIPFVKGQSGNPAGKPKGATHSSTRLRRLLELIQKKKNPVTGVEEEFSTLELMDAAQIAKALKGDSKAYEALLDRLEGKPVQTQQVTIENPALEEVRKRFPSAWEKKDE
jgi:hypothetical protein